MRFTLEFIKKVNYAKTSLPDLCDKVFLYRIWLGPVWCQLPVFLKTETLILIKL
jgi:hypothetical protein